MKKNNKPQLMDKLIDVIVNRRKWIEKIFIILIIASVFCYFQIGVNYDLTKYLPKSAPSKQGIDVMEEEFGYPGSARVMIGDVTLYEAKLYKEKIELIDGVDTVTWADSAGQIYVSGDFLAAQDLSDYYKDGYAIMDIQFDEGDTDSGTYAAINEIKALLGDKGYYSGPSIDNKTLSETMANEIPNVMVFVVVLIVVILTATTTSWFEPVLFMVTMVIAIILNMGTNIIFGEISFLSSSVAAIIQLAVAMDYSIFLLHTFSAEKKEGISTEHAMSSALRTAIPSILSSGATTIIGFAALALMQFGIGKDLGLVLAKSIVWSLVTVLFLMPALIIRWDKYIEKSAHRLFIPPLDKLSKVIYKTRYLVLAAVVIVIVPAYTAQNMNNFMYGTASMGGGEGTKAYEDQQKMKEVFGENNALMVIIPNTSPIMEKDLTDELDALSYVKSATSLSATLPAGMPESFFPKSLTEQLHTDNYARIIVVMDCETESAYSFQCSDEIQEITNRYYPDNTYFVGGTPATQDIKNIILSDYSTVNLISILGVAVVVFLSFRSLAATLAVMIPIEVAIYINTALPYLYGNNLAFLGFLIVSSLQLGATVDYAILMTNTYLDIRKNQANKHKAAIGAMSKCGLSIMTSGTVLTVVGYGLYFMSSVATISDLGQLIGRGALLSMFFVLALLPGLLSICDRLIMRDRHMVTWLPKLRKVMLRRIAHKKSPLPKKRKLPKAA